MNNKLCFIIAIIILTLSGCGINNSHYETMEQADKLVESVKDIANKYNYQITEKELAVTERAKSLVININEDEYIDIYIKNHGYRSKSGDQVFSMEYYQLKETNDFDLNLFLEFLNAVSAKEITNDELTEFLNADEDKYPPEKFNYTKLDDEKVKKVKSTFWQDWEFIYSELKDGSSSLYFGGKTK